MRASSRPDRGGVYASGGSSPTSRPERHDGRRAITSPRVSSEPNMEGSAPATRSSKFVETGAARYVAYIDGRTSASAARCSSPSSSAARAWDHRGRHRRSRRRALRRHPRRDAPLQGGRIALASIASPVVAARSRPSTAAILPTLLESELFGATVAGAFSGADRDKPGLIKLADRRSSRRGSAMYRSTPRPSSCACCSSGGLPDRRHRTGASTSASCARPTATSTSTRAGSSAATCSLVSASTSCRPAASRSQGRHLPPRAELRGEVRAPEPRVRSSFVVALIHYDWPFSVRRLELHQAWGRPHRRPGARHGAPARCDHRAYEGLRRAPGATLPADPALDVASGDDGASDGSAAADGRLIPPPGMPGHGAGAPTGHELRELLQRHRGNVAPSDRARQGRMQIHRWLKKYNIDLGTYR